MRFWVLICCIIALVTIVVWMLKCRMRVRSYGFMFCKLVGELGSIIAQIEKIRGDESICNVEQAVLEEHVKLVYTPGDEANLFDQLEWLMVDIEEFYDEIKDYEGIFRGDDWERIQDANEQFHDLRGYIRFKEWQKGYRNK